MAPMPLPLTPSMARLEASFHATRCASCHGSLRYLPSLSRPSLRSTVPGMFVVGVGLVRMGAVSKSCARVGQWLACSSPRAATIVNVVVGHLSSLHSSFSCSRTVWFAWSDSGWGDAHVGLLFCCRACDVGFGGLYV